MTEDKVEEKSPFETFDAVVDSYVSDKEQAAGIKIASRQLMENVALDMSLIAADAIGVTLWAIYESGVYGGGLQAPSLDKIAKKLVEVRDNENG